ncbi:MAG TPA: ATP-binding protein [Terriglobales bacterium]|nr:ATP-binding protein [Terriglobales bacterium]
MSAKRTPASETGFSRTEDWVDGFLVLDESLRITQFRGITDHAPGISQADAVGELYSYVVPELQGRAVEDALTRAIRDRACTEAEHYHEHTQRWFRIRACPAEPGALWLIFHDTTKSKHAERALQVAGERISELLDSVSDGVFALDEQWRFSYVNRRFEELWSRSRDDLIGKIIWDEFPSIIGTNMFHALRLSAKQSRRVHFSADIPNLGIFEGEVYACGSGVCVHVLHPTSKERERSVALQEQIVWAEERERQRSARELHDGATQLLTALAIGLSNIADVKSVREAQAHARRLKAIASRVLKEVGRFTRGLTGLDMRDGLQAGLQNLIFDWQSSYGIAATLDLEDVKHLSLPVATQMSIYRIVQEALSNTARHSGATRAAICFRLRQSRLELTIQDNGRGFSLAEVTNSGDTHFGLRSMRERAELLGGTLNVSSIADRGTCVRASIPIPNLSSTAA